MKCEHRWAEDLESGRIYCSVCGKDYRDVAKDGKN